MVASTKPLRILLVKPCESAENLSMQPALGFPTETLEEMEQTVRFALDSKWTLVQFFFGVPQKATPHTNSPINWLTSST